MYIIESTPQHVILKLYSTLISAYCYLHFRGLLSESFKSLVAINFGYTTLKLSLQSKDSHGPLHIEIRVPSNFYTFSLVILN